MTNDIRWGIIGCGNVTEVKSGPAFRLVEGSDLVAVMSRSADRARDYATRHGVPHHFNDADQLIHHPDVDAVYIATPPGSHLEYALRVCAAGKPAYVEKPMARNYTESLQMAEAFGAAGLPLFVAYYRRGLPRFQQIKAWIEHGEIGAISSVVYRYSSPAHRKSSGADLPWRLEAEHSGGGLFLDIGCHVLDILDYILGPLGNVAGNAANIASDYAVEDSIAMTFSTTTGALGTGIWNFASHRFLDALEINGTDGQITCSVFSDAPMQLTTADGTRDISLPDPAHIQEPLIRSIVEELRGGAESPSKTASALRTAQVMDTVLAGYYGGRDDDFWNRQASWPGRPSRSR